VKGGGNFTAKYKEVELPQPTNTALFQDYIFRVMVVQPEIELPMPLSHGCCIGDYFSLRQGNVLNLEKRASRSPLQDVTFVLVPWAGVRTLSRLLTAVKNVYLDTSFSQ